MSNFHALGNDEVTESLKQLPGFRPCSPKDTYKGKIKSHESSVVNLDNSNGAGTHFSCYYNSPNSQYVYYFDSYGALPPKQIEKYLKSSGKVIQYNSTQYQPIASILCGYYCIYVLLKLYKGESFYDILAQFDMNSPEHNDEFIKSKFTGQKGGSANNNDDSNILGDVIGNVAKEGISDALSDVLPEGLAELLPLIAL